MITIGGREVVASGTLYLDGNEEVLISEGGVELTIRFNQDDNVTPAGLRQGIRGQHLLELPNHRITTHNPFSSSFAQEGFSFFVLVSWPNEVSRVLTYTIFRDERYAGSVLDD